MCKVVLLTIIVGVTIWTTRADNTAKESECREEIERELQEYVKLESWQELFREHFKFIVTKNGEILSEKNRLKFSTIIHNAIYGCNHERDDEVDDCPNIFEGSIKSCEIGRNLRAAMFRTARCTFVESSVKHIVLSDAMLDVYPMDMLDRLTMDMDQPIREFGENVVNMLSTLGHGELGGLGELMALNLYLNNGLGTVFMHRVPVAPITSPDDFAVAKRRMRTVHGAILDGLYAFWDTWCSDADVVAQYRRKYSGSAYIVLVSEMDKNIRESEAFVRALNVSDNVVVPLDLDPRRVALTDYAERVASAASMPAALSADMRLRAFRASFEFDPRAVHEHQASVFRAVYTCFYWNTIVHLKLGLRLAAERRGGDDDDETAFVVNFVRYVRPLAVFDLNRFHFVVALSPEAVAHLTRLLAFLLKMYRVSRNPHHHGGGGVFSSSPIIREFVDLLSADMHAVLNMNVPDEYFDRLSRGDALKLMQSNYRAFARLVAATSAFKEDRVNAIKLKRFMFFLSEAVDFDAA